MRDHYLSFHQYQTPQHLKTHNPMQNQHIQSRISEHPSYNTLKKVIHVSDNNIHSNSFSIPQQDGTFKDNLNGVTYQQMPDQGSKVIIPTQNGNEINITESHSRAESSMLQE